MRSVGIGNSKDWGEEQKVKIEREQETLNKKIEAFNRRIEELEDEKEQMKASYEREKDPELDPEFQRMVERAITRVANKQGELKKRREELIIKKNELENEERQLKVMMEHEKYPEWLELKRKRDKAVEEVERLEAEMKRLMESVIFDTRSR
ncbi:MAG: hypothetical protein IBX41_05865 [Methanophagales archaeon]|nr:hypothetical protein [Methanophagales archaeon]